MIYTIYPYKVVNSQGERFWYFDDELRDLKMEGLVSGTDDLLDKYAGGHEKVKLLFSNNPFDGSTIALTLVDNKVSDMTGYWYKDNTGHLAWLCPALNKYFKQAPNKVYAQIIKE